ncbi:type II secretion system GspH family protein [Bacillus sp. IITD106]|nr:type II secretion system GspH family protein [Bacillus sp. IITD106]
MIKKYITQQQGITLLELLATIAISTLIIGLTFSVLFSSKKFNDKTEAYSNLRQEANIIISNIRKHHENLEKVCYDQLLTQNNISMDIQINEVELKSGNCWNPTISNDTHVKFTLKDKKQQYSFDVDTIIEGKERKEFTINFPGQPTPEPPIKDETFYDYLKNNNIFVYGTDLGIFGSTPVRTDNNGNGTVVINNLNHSNLVFGGNNVLTVNKIYIDKKGNDVVFNSSTSLGDLNKTELVRIDGNVQLNNGAAKIYGDTIYIDGNVNFNDSADINGKKVIINGNVTFKNWSAKLKATEIYIAGKVTTTQPGNIEGHLKNFDQLGEKDIPEKINILPPTFREESWYRANGYEVRSTGHLSNGSRIFSKDSFKLDDYQNNRSNVIIISKGDITLNNFGSSELTGILFAPNGKVTFKGGAFKGIVIARDGFYTGSNPSITFSNVVEFIGNPELAPFK